MVRKCPGEPSLSYCMAWATREQNLAFIVIAWWWIIGRGRRVWEIATRPLDRQIARSRPARLQLVSI